MLQTRLGSLACSKVGWVSSHQKCVSKIGRIIWPPSAHTTISIVPGAAQSAPLPPPSGWSRPLWDSSHSISWISLDDLRSLKARATFVGHSAAAEESAAAVSMSASTDHFHASERSVAQARAQCRLRSHHCGDGRPRRATAAPRRKTSRRMSLRRPVAAAATWQRWPPCNTGKNVLFKNVDSVLRRTQRSLPATASAVLPVLTTWVRLLPSLPVAATSCCT